MNKTLNLLIDGVVVASEHRWVPKDITLHADFDHGGTKHSVVAHQSVKPILDTDDSIEVDGEALALKKTK